MTMSKNKGARKKNKTKQYVRKSMGRKSKQKLKRTLSIQWQSKES